MYALRPRSRFARSFRVIFALSSSIAALGALTGCGIGPVDTSETGTLNMRGTVMGGQQPVSSSHIYMFSPGLAGTGVAANGGASTSIQVLPVTTDAYGQFNLTGAYLCQNNNAQAYMVAVGGNPGLGAGTNNTSIVMMAALGRCGDLYTTAAVEVNELTTVAAAWALAPFYKAYDHIGASATNGAGVANAFANAALLTDAHTGQLSNLLGASRTVESGKLYALANALAGCVNSNGSTCGTLFSAATPSGGTAPTNTLDAAVSIVRNPGQNVHAVYVAGSSFPPYPTTLPEPNDWTMSMTVKGGGLSAPAGIGVDAGGYVWVADYTGALSEFSAQGVAQSATGYGVGTLASSYGLAIGPTGNVWTTNAESPYHYPTEGSVIEFSGSASTHPGNIVFGPYGDYTMNYPTWVAVDSDNSVFVNNYYGASATHIAPGVGVTGALGAGSSTFPVVVAVDASHGVWLANNSDTTVTHVDSSGNVLAHPSCCDEANGIALDASGNAWVSSYGGSYMSEVSAAGTTTLTGLSGGGVANPAGVTVDAAQDVWVANYRGASISKLAGNGNTLAAGTAISPATGYGRDAALQLPAAIALDNSGDVWVSNYNKNNIVEFIGLAAPTATPIVIAPVAP